MTTIPLARPRDRSALAGWALLALFALFMLGASVLPKLAMTEMVRSGMADLGWPDAPVLLIGAAEALFTLLVLWPRTAPLGAVLMTGLLGGAIATQAQAHAPMLSTTLFGTYVGAIMWAGVILRDARLKAFLPWR